MGRGEKEVNRIEQIWRNDFALSYKDKPRLYNVIKDCRLGVDIDDTQDFSTKETTAHKPAVLTYIDNREFE